MCSIEGSSTLKFFPINILRPCMILNGQLLNGLYFYDNYIIMELKENVYLTCSERHCDGCRGARIQKRTNKRKDIFWQIQ